VLIAVSSIRYLKNLAEIGLLDSIKHAESKGCNIIILYSEEWRNDDNAATMQLISALKTYGQIKSVPGIHGCILLIDNSKLLTINEEGAEAFALYSDNKFLVENFGSHHYQRFQIPLVLLQLKQVWLSQLSCSELDTIF
jgi:hypothetical protein